MKALKTALALLVGDAQSDRVVPPTGHTVRLTLFSAGAMAFLAVFALALSMATGRLASLWGDELARSSTIRISAPEAQVADQTAAALKVLETTPGVASARALTTEEQQQLLEPWFGNGLSLDGLPVPQLIEVVEKGDGFDAEGLRLRLQAEVPGATLDDHTRWRRPLVKAARSLRLLGALSLILIGGTMAAMITLAATAALAANSQVIRVLRLVGAQDSYIAGAFVRRFTLRALIGGAAGTAVGMIAVALLPSAQPEGGFLTGLGFEGWHWLWPLLIPPLGAVVAFVATREAAMRTLRGLR
ncbi:cell division protein FtsX [Donghicola tyrosinivorans]|uniref:Cell division transport system permease protein n=1 Tax=Donghicola tyrosinivorans TaxID=1652492 RepID=A0A2T0X013_9RHOB|nr:cell division protein FtsX [Donghicola tyrosinivorans]PRY92292.1 cell division transport system permease protein [Donghicola tyrosinivorans]